MQEHFFGIAIEDGSIQAAIWTVKDGTTEVVSLSSSVTYEDDETLISGADEALSSCVQTLAENVAEPTKTVFGVPAFWVVDGQIERQYLDKIRLICNKLSLNPTGFVVIPEAISFFEKSQEKAPMSAILIGVYGQSIDVSLFRLGNLAGTVNVTRSVSIVDDVVEGLTRFESREVLPSRFLLYDSKPHDLEDMKQELIKSEWGEISNDVKFLHTPQVEILATESKMTAISLAGAVEMGNLSEVKVASVMPTTTSEKNEEEVEEVIAERDNNLGEVVDPATLGFSHNFEEAQPRYDEKEDGRVISNTRESLPMSVKKKIRSVFRLASMIIHRRAGEGVVKKKFLRENLLFILVIIVFFSLVGGFVFFWFVPKAEVTVVIEARKLEGRQLVKFETDAGSVDFSKLVIPVREVSTTVSLSKTKTATGSITIGSPAKGEVTFYNSGDEVELVAGTTLEGAGMEFLLDSDVKVASGSAASIATSNGNITSKGVGASYNAASGTIFSVGNHSTSLQAKNGADLSGGSSQEVTAVSQEDADILTEELTDELGETGKDNLKSQLSGDTLFIDSSLTVTTISASFDHEVGEEATIVKLTEEAKVTGLTFLRSDMNELAKKLYESQVPEGFSLKDDQIDFVTSAKDTQFIINLLPNIDTGKIARQIAGKNLESARTILSSLPGYKDVEVEVSPYISLLPYLPRVANNIEIILSAK